MTNSSLPNPSRLVAKALGVALASAALSGANAQAQTTNATELPAVVVTGSLIPTAETVGPSPVDTVSSEAISKLGSQDVLDTLKKLSPSFSGNGNIGQTLNNGGGGEAYIAVRNLPTLVLLNGRRLANSAFSSGAAVDVNTIPVSMIDRIEVLKDGSSALYGSDAIGGVVNIITKKNFSGVEVGGRYGFTTAGDDYSESSAWVVGGTTTEKSSFVGGAQWFHSEPLLTTDRDVGSMGISDLISRNLLPPTYISPSFPGRVQSGGVSYILAGSPFAVGAPGYNAAITKPPSPANPSVGGINYVPGNYSSVASYNSAHPGVYVPISSTPIGQQLDAAFANLGITGEQAGWPLLNTTEFGTYTIQSQDRRQFFANGSHELYGKQMELFADFLYANTESRGVLAPAPLSSLGIGNITIAADAPINPFQIALGANGAGSPRVRSRFVEVGNRLYENQNDVYHFVGGLKGTFESDYAYEVAYNYNRNDQIQFLRNSPNGAALQSATQANADPLLAAAGFSQFSDATGPVPLYDPFALPGGNDPRTVNALRATGLVTGFSELWGVDGRFTGGLFDLPGGKVQFAIGGGFYSEALQITYDPLTELGQLIGQNQNYSTPLNRRDSASGFVEVRIPITSPEQDIKGLHSLEITAAGRYESFDPGGDAAVPKVAVRWQPLDKQVTLRGSYSQSFLAPNVFQLYGAPVVSFDTVNAGGNGQVQMNWTSEPNLKPANADNWGGGIVISPDFVKGLTLSVDYYHIKTKNDVFRVGAQAVADSLNQFGAASEFAGDFFFDDGSKLTTTAPDQVEVANWGTGARPLRNGASQETDGLDITANYELPTEKCGKFTFYASANVLFNYTYADPLVGGPYHYEGQFTDNGPAGGAQGTLPDFVINTGLSWDYKGFTASINAQFIPAVDDLGDMHPSAGEPSNSYTVNGEKWNVPSFYTIDMQLAYEFGKASPTAKWLTGTRLAVGCRNITDNTAPLIASSSEDFTDKSTYDIVGRFVYFQVTKKF